ncbi:MAG: NAD(P)-dependent oxidoreductase [Bacilli bacterium]
MKSALVGFTGFVGSNLTMSKHFDGLYNTKNIEQSYGTNPDLLIYAGIRAEKFIANKYPEKDLESIKEAINNIKKINPKTLVLISTIDVYDKPIDVIESTKILKDNLLPYGKNRLFLEEWVEENFSNYLIVRLPGLYGINIKKNFIYDMIHYLPSQLNFDKFKELSIKNKIIDEYYIDQNNGYYKLKLINKDEYSNLKNVFEKLSYSALNFTDSRGYFQFYNLKYLWMHIDLALKNKIKIINLATEPICVNELYNKIFETEFINEIQSKPPYYDFKTQFGNLMLSNIDNYIFDKEFILNDIKQFVEEQHAIINI